MHVTKCSDTFGMFFVTRSIVGSVDSCSGRHRQRSHECPAFLDWLVIQITSVSICGGWRRQLPGTAVGCCCYGYMLGMWAAVCVRDHVSVCDHVRVCV